MLKYFFLSFVLSFILASIYRLFLSYQSKKLDIEVYNTVLEAYEGIKDARKTFYTARFVQDEGQRNGLEKSARELYDICVQTLDSDLILERVNQLPESLKEKALNMINSPRYGLF